MPKVITIILSFLLFASHYGVGQMTFLGSGSQLNDRCAEITPNLNNQSGWVYNSEKFDLSIRDTIEFDIHVGDNNFGADGMTFILHNDSRQFNAQGCVGEAMGYGNHPSGPTSSLCGFGDWYAISPSIAFEFDTYRNANQGDPSADHIAYLENGNINHGTNYVSMPNIEDGNEHRIMLIWDPATTSMELYFDGALIISQTRDLINDIFSGTTEVIVGFAASTGGARNQHYVCSVDDDVVFTDFWTVQSGDFDDANIWSSAPGAGDCATILSGHSVTLTQNETVGGITIQQGATLDLQNRKLSLDACDLDNNGTLNAENGELEFESGSSQNFNLGGDLTIRDLEVTNDATVDINEGRLYVEGSVDIGNPGTLNTNDQLTLVSNTSGTGRIGRMRNNSTINGDVTVQRHIYSDRRIWRYLSSPVQNTKVIDWQFEIPISGTFDTPDTGVVGSTGIVIMSGSPSMYEYNESTAGVMDNGWENYPAGGSSADADINRGQGYAIFVRDNAGRPDYVDVTGPINRGTINCPISYTNTGNPTEDGWNLVGNPYPSQIDWDRINANNRRSLDNGVYYRDNDTDNPIARSYVDGVGNPAGTTGIIGSSQAFWVHATASNARLRIRENNKVTTSYTFYKTAAPDQLLRLKLSNGNTTDETVFRFRENATNNFDSEYDAYQLPHDHVKISTFSKDGTELSIDSREVLESTDTIPVLLENLKKNKMHTISFNGISSFYDEFKFQLYDTDTDSTHDLSDGDYEFKSTGKESSMLLIATPLKSSVVSPVTSIQEDLSTELSIYPNPATGSYINIDLIAPNSEDFVIEIRNTLGSIITSKHITNLEGTGKKIKGSISIEDLAPGVYIITVKGEKFSATKRIIKK